MQPILTNRHATFSDFIALINENNVTSLPRRLSFLEKKMSVIIPIIFGISKKKLKANKGSIINEN